MLAAQGWVQRVLNGSRVHHAVLMAALVLGIGAAQFARALEVGHARMLSSAGQPLRLVVPLTDLSPDEAATLVVRASDALAWRQNGLTPPVKLSDLEVTVRPGTNARRRDLLVTAIAVPQDDVVDMLLELHTSAGQRRIQVSFVVPTQAVPGADDIQLARIRAAQMGQTERAVTVRRGDTLSGIALAHRYTGASLYQMLLALYQANPQAFGQHNMNIMAAGQTLAIPEADTVYAIDPEQARRLFLAHAAAFARYRAGMAESPGVVAGGTPDSGRLQVIPAAVTGQDVTAGDRLRLSSETPSAANEQVADEQVALARAEREMAARLAQLEHTVGDIQQALAARTGVPASQMTLPVADDIPGQGGVEQAAAVSVPSVTATADTSLTQNDMVGKVTSAPFTPVSPSPSEADQTDGAWLPDNLPVWVMGLLALFALVIAWVRRRGSEGRDDDGALFDDDVPAEPNDAQRAQFARRLESIDLDLSSAAEDSGHWSRR